MKERQLGAPVQHEGRLQGLLHGAGITIGELPGAEVPETMLFMRASSAVAPLKRRIRFGRTGRHARGQSLVEFVLVVPTLLFLVIIVADFGRIFAVGVALEAATRDAAEVVANEYLGRPPGPLDAPAPPPDPSYYNDLHSLGAATVCAETSDLPNSQFDSATGTCPGMPLIRMCIHDSQDTECGTEAHGSAVPGQCTELTSGLSNSQAGAARYVEVRTCYRFTPILQLPLLSFGEIWLQRTRVFAVPCYFVLGDAECG